MNNPTDQENSLPAGTNNGKNETPTIDSRRRFTRDALVSGAVMFSLDNRVAWGAVADGTCLSEPTWLSWNPPTGTFASFDPANPRPGQEAKVENDRIARFIQANNPMVVERPPEMGGGTFVCATPEKTDESKLIRQRSILSGKGSKKDWLE